MAEQTNTPRCVGRSFSARIGWALSVVVVFGAAADDGPAYAPTLIM